MRIFISLLVLLVLGVASLAIAMSHNSPCGSASPAGLRQPMKAAVYRCYGAADVVRIESIERPVPSDHGVLVRVHATSINPLDWHFMRGEPYIVRTSSGWGAPKDTSMGTDFAGTVEAVGKLVTRFKPGDQVFGAGHAAFAQYLRTPEDAVVALKPANLSFEQAAAVPVAGITALQALRDAGQLRAGQKVLINGAGRRGGYICRADRQGHGCRCDGGDQCRQPRAGALARGGSCHRLQPRGFHPGHHPLRSHPGHVR